MPETIDQTADQTNESVSQSQRDLIDQLLKPEVQESLTVLVDQLPKLTELVNILTKSYDFAQSVATDEVLKMIRSVPLQKFLSLSKIRQRNRGYRH